MVERSESLGAGLRFRVLRASGRQPSARVPFGARPGLTLTRGSVRLVHTAISSRMLMSG